MEIAILRSQVYSHSITSTTAALNYWTAVAKFSDTNLVDAGAAQIGCSFLTLAWTRTVPSGLREDRVTCTFAIAKDPGGKLWSTIIDADKATAEGHFDTWWTSEKTNVANQYTLAEYRWHDWHAGESTLGPADRVTAKSVAGTGGGTSRIPDQNAFAVTFTTASRRHWGRVYLPGFTFGRLDNTTGRFASASVDGTTLNMHTLASNLHGSSLDIVVASRQHAGIMEVATIQADDICDIQRRRRAKQANYHKIYTS